jgi:hypothetical protein
MRAGCRGAVAGACDGRAGAAVSDASGDGMLSGVSVSGVAGGRLPDGSGAALWDVALSEVAGLAAVEPPVRPTCRAETTCAVGPAAGVLVMLTISGCVVRL